MALTKANGSITQLTSAGNSTEIDVANAYACLVSIKHVNGTGTITEGAIVKVQISHDGTNWEDDTTFKFEKTASATEFRTYPVPLDGITLDAIRLVYTAPTGSSGHALDARFSKATAL